jgi:hypothetical protein
MKRTAIFSEGYVGCIGIEFSPERWANIRVGVPELPAEKDAELRNAVAIACSGYLEQQNKFAMGYANAAALRDGAKERSEFERFTTALRQAAISWEALRGIHDDQLSEIRRFDELAGMADDADRRLAGLRALGDPRPIHAPESPWRGFVRALHTSCKGVGLVPTLTKRQYADKGATPWFQEFVLAVRDNLLGDKGYPKHSVQAFHSETYEAIHGGEVKAG